MNGKVSAGLLMYRRVPGGLQVFLVHPGGPYFHRKDLGAWTVPKGLCEAGEGLLETAVREFHEETGLEARGPYQGLGEIVQSGGKTVHAWAFEGEWDPASGLRSNTFDLEWPPRSGRVQRFPEIDRAGWFTPKEARAKINPAQIAFLERLEALE